MEKWFDKWFDMLHLVGYIFMASRKKLVGNNLCFTELDLSSCETYADGMRVLGKAPTQEFRKDTYGYLKSTRLGG